MNLDRQSSHRLSYAKSLADSVGFDLLGTQLGWDLELALKAALEAGAVFPVGTDPMSIFRSTLQASICDIEADKRGLLFQRFLRDGPYEGEGDSPLDLYDKRLTERETASAITFIYSFMVNSFKGAITELLAAAACQQLMREPRFADTLPPSTRLFVGDAVMVNRALGKNKAKGADLHFLVIDGHESEAPCVTVAGVGEVKSGHKSSGAIVAQLEKHILRAKRGIRVSGVDYSGSQVRLGRRPDGRIIRISIQPSDWPLPRTLRFETTTGKRRLVLDPPTPPLNEDHITPMNEDCWHISLRWSKEALAAAAYEMTFWYMEKVGEIIYTKKGDEPDPKPAEWGEMTPAEAGQNAIKMMLYYAIRPYAVKAKEETLSEGEARIMQKAIALYNSYGFGYALGMNFRNKAGRREMLWPEDLDEIAANGRNKDGCRIR